MEICIFPTGNQKISMEICIFPIGNMVLDASNSKKTTETSPPSAGTKDFKDIIVRAIYKLSRKKASSNPR
jgi:hypothetical protein